MKRAIAPILLAICHAIVGQSASANDFWQGQPAMHGQPMMHGQSGMQGQHMMQTQPMMQGQPMMHKPIMHGQPAMQGQPMVPAQSTMQAQPTMHAQPMMQAPPMMQAQPMQSHPMQSHPMQQSQSMLPGQSTPMLNSAVSAQSYQPIPGTAGEPGVDILEESLKFHNLGHQPAAVAQHANAPAPAQNRNPNASLMSTPLFGPGSLQSKAGIASGGDAGSSQGKGVSTQAIGAIGAAALLGTFITNGGVGGMMKSVGWNNTRHIRGASIGY